MNSSTKMVADSTSAMLDTNLKANTKKRKKNMSSRSKEKPVKKVKKAKIGGKKKSKKLKASKNKDHNSDSDYSDLDLSKDVQPIGNYIKNREEMINEMFRSVKGGTLKGLVPDILKTIDMDELKKLCLEQLAVMSKKRIRLILAGHEPDTISSSGTDDETSEGEGDAADVNKTNDVPSSVDDGIVVVQNGGDKPLNDNEPTDVPEHVWDDSCFVGLAADSTSEPKEDNTVFDSYGDISSQQSSVGALSPPASPVVFEKPKRRIRRMIVKPKHSEEAEEGECSEEEEYEEVTDDEGGEGTLLQHHRTEIEQRSDCEYMEADSVIDVDSVPKSSEDVHDEAIDCEVNDEVAVRSDDGDELERVSFQDDEIFEDNTIVREREDVEDHNREEIKEDTVAKADEFRDSDEISSATKIKTEESENDLTYDSEVDAALGALGEEEKAQLKASGGVDVLTKNQLEILELEMRARAIKAMLKVHEQKEMGFIGKLKKL